LEYARCAQCRCGSSPRAWGTHSSSSISSNILRFIPTCMGNSVRLILKHIFTQVHPHVHGELTWTTVVIVAQNGSSPRAWGTHIIQTEFRLSQRFIPTCMGNSTYECGNKYRATVHPHVHGELYKRSISVSVRIGSSPRAWGTRARPATGPGILRFIPTCMGNSHSRICTSPPRSVHPHVHGELLEYARCAQCRCGSSPRAWGTHYVVFDEGEAVRFIPTCMGNSSSRSSGHRRCAVHPHVHGELVNANYGESG